jgi:hypothetical protein
MPKIELKYVFDDMADFQRYMDGFDTEAPAPAVTVDEEPVRTAEVTAAPTATATAEPEITANTDADGLPYDPEIHATPKSVTADGLWRAKRGKADEANQARAAFKASGGAVVAPVIADEPVATAPVMPGMPVVAARAPEPITYDKLIDKTMGMMERGKIDSDAVVKLYGVVGLADPAVLETNESMRAALFAKLCEIEPELS